MAWRRSKRVSGSVPKPPGRPGRRRSRQSLDLEEAFGIMTPKVRRGRIYWRTRGGVPRAWGDFRDFPDGKREPLVPPGDRLATTDPLVADILVAERVRALEAKRRGVAFGFDSPGVTLGAFAQEHLEQKARSGRTTSTWIATSQVYLERAVSYFGSGRTLHTIETVHVEAWVEHLRGVRYRGAPIAEGTVLQHLLVLSNLFRRAQKRKLVPLGHNPVWALEEKPQVRRREAAWLEVHEAALVLEAARLYRPAPGRTLPYTFPLIATFLLTGGRRDEVLGLQVEDVSFERKTVRFHPNPFRRGARGKSRHAERIVPSGRSWPRSWASIWRPARRVSCSFPPGRAAPSGGWATSGKRCRPSRRWPACRARSPRRSSGIPTAQRDCRPSIAASRSASTWCGGKWAMVTSRWSGKSTGTLAPFGTARPWSSSGRTFILRRSVINCLAFGARRLAPPVTPRIVLDCHRRRLKG